MGELLGIRKSAWVIRHERWNRSQRGKSREPEGEGPLDFQFDINVNSWASKICKHVNLKGFASLQSFSILRPCCTFSHFEALLFARPLLLLMLYIPTQPHPPSTNQPQNRFHHHNIIPSNAQSKRIKKGQLSSENISVGVKKNPFKGDLSIVRYGQIISVGGWN